MKEPDMKKVIATEGSLPIKLWLEDIEEGALAQAADLAKLPFAFRHIALMPDAHQGYGMPIGGVLATKGVIIPNAVGVDIGCGVCAVKTSVLAETVDKDAVKKIMGRIRELIPVGFSHHTENQPWEGFDQAPDIPEVQKEINSARKQLGTLGGGNHFLEVQAGDDGHVWLMLHSGSRNFGLKIANAFHGMAVKCCERWFSNVPNKDLAFIPLDLDFGQQYLQAMNFALLFAQESRSRMMSKMCAAVESVFHQTNFAEQINVHHNYARMENHFGENVLIHRKGATSAQAGEIGLVPGSQGTASYVVEGLGNPESFMSCSHGAGRKMGRKQACRELSLADEIKRLDDQGIVHGIRSEKDLDEAAGAYKDIATVMENQADLVRPVVALRPLGVVKG
jgi:tRNA-splicing ligase RtcB (3'-phosphate/5'-hydroxy nucleic acid ligase)